MTKQFVDNTPRSPSTRPAIQCFICGARWSFIGTEPHPGVCPECGEVTVSVSGALALLSPEPMNVEGGAVVDDEMCRLVGHDASGREFQYYFQIRESDGEVVLVRLTINNHSVDLTMAIGTDVLPMSAIVEALGEVAAGNVVRPLDSDGADPTEWESFDV